MPSDHSDRNESATGVCSNCGTMMQFAAGKGIDNCPRCGLTQDRMITGAVSPKFQQHGYRPGEGVVVRTPWR